MTINREMKYLSNNYVINPATKPFFVAWLLVNLKIGFEFFAFNTHFGVALAAERILEKILSFMKCRICHPL